MRFQDIERPHPVPDGADDRRLPRQPDNPTTLDNLKVLDLPTMVLRGAETTAPDRRISEIVRDHIPGCGYEIIASAEHMLPVTHPGPVADAIMRHLLAEGA